MLVSNFSKIIFSFYISSNDDALLISDVYQMTFFQTFQNSIFALLTFLRFFTIPSPSATSLTLFYPLYYNTLSSSISDVCNSHNSLFSFYSFVVRGLKQNHCFVFHEYGKALLVSLFFHLVHTYVIYLLFSLSFRIHF